MLESKVIHEKKQGTALMKNIDGPVHKKVYIESYGCQMNFSDSEIVASILQDIGYATTKDIKSANLILINTCSIREKAEQTVRRRLNVFRATKNKNTTIGILGCMAERLKSKFLEEEKLVDLVVGPDAYRDLPNLLKEVDGGRKAINVILSKEETYADLSPVRLDKNGITSFVSIMRGCDNMCSFCVVPFTRGRERSRKPETIVDEIQELENNGYKEVTLLGQNVDSYLWTGGGLKKNFKTLSLKEQKNSMNFAQLLELVAKKTSMRIRFSTSHPKDMTDEVLYTMARHKNICKYIHLPVQSGSSKVLKLMNRGYDREWYLNRIKSIKEIIPECGISMDIITGFCQETERDHQDTLSLMKKVKYDFGYMFKYSERPNTLAERKYEDDVPELKKSKRLKEIIDLQQKHSLENNLKYIGKVCKVLIEGYSKKSDKDLCGRNTQNTVVVFPKENAVIGSIVNVKITKCTSGTLLGQII